MQSSKICAFLSSFNQVGYFVVRRKAAQFQDLLETKRPGQQILYQKVVDTCDTRDSHMVTHCSTNLAI